ncbi:MAG TPA: hypothetical protein VGT98_18210 [Candidatus Elarobacter sp.]|nr:hypothetical protein [Candidatus Elarobacter sp.]HEV2737443.1 hypothetical protein [Candidatus Elarobacter sp.]
MMRTTVILSAGLFSCASGGAAFAQQAAPPPCSAAVRTALDFWVGDWTVTLATAQHERAGADRVERASKGAAVIERWADTAGGEGTSLFSFDPYACTWHQLWITDDPAQVGGLKHKDLVALLPGGGVRFQGAYPGRRAVTVLDRTTLTPRPDGTVRQVIEVSVDGGATWNTGFDAIYTRGGGPPAPAR